jgi:hypothetical protein
MSSLDDKPAPKNKATVYKEAGIHAGESQGSNDGTFGNDKNNNREFDEAKIRGGSIYELNKTNKAERDHFKRYGQTISQSREVQQQRELEKTKKEQKQVQEIKNIVDKQIEAHFNLNPLPSPPKQIVPVPPKGNTPLIVPLIPPNNQGFGRVLNAYVMRNTYEGINGSPASAPASPALLYDANPDVWERIKQGFINRNIANAQCYGVEISFITREYIVQNTGSDSGTFNRKTFRRKMIFDNIGMLQKVTEEVLVSKETISGSETGGGGL